MQMGEKPWPCKMTATAKLIADRISDLSHRKTLVEIAIIARVKLEPQETPRSGQQRSSQAAA